MKKRLGLVTLSGTLLLIGAVAAAATAFATKPSQADVERILKDQMVTSITRSSVDPQRDLFGSLLLFGCKFGPDQCYELLRQAMDITYDDKVLFAAVAVVVDDTQTNCLAMLNQLYCPKFLNDGS